MVIKGDNCLICLHHEHSTDSCFGKDQTRTICGLDGCGKRHHPSLHSAPQVAIQSVKAATHLMSSETGEIVPGVSVAAAELEVKGKEISNILGLPGRFMSRVNSKKVQCHKISWSEKCWTGGTESVLEEIRAKELD